jgi:hypothetical protein
MTNQNSDLETINILALDGVLGGSNEGAPPSSGLRGYRDEEDKCKGEEGKGVNGHLNGCDRH